MRNRSSYQYYNRNPDGKHLEDCVCRAISTATGLNYGAVDRLLSLTASCYRCDKLCVCCYHNLLEDILGYERHMCRHGETVEDIVRKYPEDKLLIRIKAHLTSAIKGTILDIWDCSDRIMHKWWVK